MLTITEFNDSLSLALAPITLISGVGLFDDLHDQSLQPCDEPYSSVDG